MYFFQPYRVVLEVGAEQRGVGLVEVLVDVGDLRLRDAGAVVLVLGFLDRDPAAAVADEDVVIAALRGSPTRACSRR